MQNRVPWLLVSLFLTLLATNACKDTNSQASDEAKTPLDSVKVAKKPAILQVYAWVDKLRLREEPNTKSAILKELQEGEALIFTGKKSDFTQKINLRGTLYDEPWLEVKTNDGTTGWAYGGGLKFYKPTVDSKPSPYDGCMALLYKNRQTQHQKCMAMVYARQLEKDKSMVRETDEGYQIKLLDGTIHSLESSPSDSLVSRLQYRYYIANMGFFVFENKDTVAASTYLLVNDKSGKKINIPAYPKPSPMGKHLLCIKVPFENTSPSQIQIYGFTNNGFEQMYQQTFEHHRPHTPKWIDDTQLEISLEPIEKDGFYTPKVLRFALEKGKWTEQKK